MPDERHCVGELVIISGAIDAVSRAFERGGHLPSRRQPKAHFSGTRELPLFEHEEIGAEEFREILYRPREREIDLVIAVIEVHGDAIGATRHHAPGILVAAVPTQRRTTRIAGAKAVDIPRVVLDLVVARTPRGQRDIQRVLAGRCKLGRDVEQPLSDGDFVADGLGAKRRRERDDEEQNAKATHHHSRQEVGPRRRAEAQLKLPNATGLGGNLRARVGDHRTQLLAGLEDRDRARCDFDWITSSWVARHPRLPLADFERPKSAYLYVVLLS